MIAVLFGSALLGQSLAVEVGFGKSDVTPKLDSTPVWIAGYGHNRKATGVHDALWARAIVLKQGTQKIALVSVDLVGLQYPLVQNVRRKLAGYDYVLVASTHNHEGPDVIGLWGPTPGESGVNRSYLEQVQADIVSAVKEAEAKAIPTGASYGTATDESLLGDYRLPIVKDGVMRVVRFKDLKSDQLLGLLVQWNCHPETLGSKNTLISADFPHFAISALEKKLGCPVVYFSGAVGGLMSSPKDRIRNAAGHLLEDGSFEFAQLYGEEVAALTEKALSATKPLALEPIVVSAKPIAIPLANAGYREARRIGILRRTGFTWAGTPEKYGPALPDRQAEGELAIETEVGYIRLGDLHIAGIPGELYPELVYGHYQEPADPNADMPTAPLEPPVMKSLPGPKTLLFGLANDEVGYIIPKRQWDEIAPFAYGRKDKQYGEVNSVGPEVAPILMKALQDRVHESARRNPPKQTQD
jgi:hypothetical protein